MPRNIKRAVIEKSRYPGLVPFSEEQSAVFKGREREIKDLYNLIVAEPLVVVFAKSGVGKSSLLYAGLFPLLKKEHYFPIKIRFQLQSVKGASPEPEPSLPRRFWRFLFHKHEIVPAGKKNDQPAYIKPTAITAMTIAGIKDAEYTIDVGGKRMFLGVDPSRLWEQIKLLTIRKKETGNSVTPVLVFDQFEELFRFPRKDYVEMIVQLAETLHTLLPRRVAQHLRGIPKASRDPEQMAYWTRQPAVKCVIAIREDKLGSLDLVKDFFPMILKNRYKLFSLNRQNAAEAMAGPAKEIDNSFTVRPFEFDPGTLDDILALLSGKGPVNNVTELPGENPESGIDGSQLQKVCMFIENKVANEQGEHGDIIVNNDFIDPHTGVQPILDNFYEDQLLTLKSSREIKLARKIIERHLVSGGARASVTKKQMDLLLNDNRRFLPEISKDDFLQKLIDARLVKEEYTHLGRTFELGHETLVNSVARFAAENKLQLLSTRNFRLMISIAVCSIFMFAALIMFGLVSKLSNKSSMSLGATYFQQGNHFYAFNIWDNYTGKLISTGGDKPMIDTMLNVTRFFDVGLGLNEIYTGDNIVSVLERDNSVNLWRMNFSGNGDSVLTVAHFFDAHGLESTDSKRFIAYRTGNQGFRIFDVVKKERGNNDIDHISDLPMAGNTSQDSLADNFAINFIPGGDFVAYVRNGRLHVYDLKAKREIRLPVMDTIGGVSALDFIKVRMRVSPDERFLAVLGSNTLHIIALKGSTQGRERIVKGVDSLYNSFKTNLIVYKSHNSLFLDSYDTVRSKTRILFHLTSDLRISPDSMRMIFYNSQRLVTVFNGNSNRVDTAFSDYFTLKRGSINMFNYLAAQWNGARRITYKSPGLDVRDCKLKYIFSGVTTLNFRDVFIYQGNSWWVEKGKGIIYMRRGNKTTKLDSSVTSLEPEKDLTADPQALISKSGRFIAYLTADVLQNFTLKVLRVDNGETVLSLDLEGIPAIRPIISDHYISIRDNKNHNGLYFFGAAVRNRSYYRKLYPKLTRLERDSLGISNIY